MLDSVFLSADRNMMVKYSVKKCVWPLGKECNNRVQLPLNWTAAL